jgi:hypothetical protein
MSSIISTGNCMMIVANRLHKFNLVVVYIGCESEAQKSKFDSRNGSASERIESGTVQFRAYMVETNSDRFYLGSEIKATRIAFLGFRNGSASERVESVYL